MGTNDLKRAGAAERSIESKGTIPPTPLDDEATSLAGIGAAPAPSSGRAADGEAAVRSGTSIDHEIRMRAMVETAVLWKYGHITTDEFYLLLDGLVK